MIFRIVDNNTGFIIKSVDCDSEATAKLYLEDGQTLFAGGGQLQIPDDFLMVDDDHIKQRPDVPDIGGYAGEGQSVIEVQ